MCDDSITMHELARARMHVLTTRRNGARHHPYLSGGRFCTLASIRFYDCTERTQVACRRRGLRGPKSGSEGSRLKGRSSADPKDTQAPDRLGRSEGLAWPSAPALLRKTENIRCHEAQFYSHDAVFLESVTHFIGAALKTGNAAIVFATKPHRDSLLQGLKAQGIDVDAAIQQGAYVSLDAADTLSTFMVNGWPDADRFFDGFRNLIQSASNAAKAEHPRVAICGEGVALLWAEAKREAAIRLEQLSNILVSTSKVDILCAYPFSLLIQEDEHAFSAICAEHSAVYSA
jgi:hypothetical protein